MKRNCQNEWSAAVNNSGKCVNLLVEQCDAEDQRVEKDKENWYDSVLWERITQNYYLAYHQATAHVCLLLTRPDEAKHYKRIQVRKLCLCVLCTIGLPLTIMFSAVVQPPSGRGKRPRESARKWLVWGN